MRFQIPRKERSSCQTRKALAPQTALGRSANARMDAGKDGIQSASIQRPASRFNALFTEYDMSATFASTYGTSYAMVIQSMCAEEGLYGYNVNASGRRCASTVFIMIVSGIILYLVYGVGARDLGERLEAKSRRRKRREKLASLFSGKEKSV